MRKKILELCVMPSCLSLVFTTALLAPSKCTKEESPQPKPNPCVQVSKGSKGIAVTPTNCRRK